MTLTDSTSDTLRAAVISGEIAPGAFVTEILVCERFAVARPTAKAAIERLAHEGILSRESNKPARVPLLQAVDIRDLYDSRLVVESAAIRILAEGRIVPKKAAHAQRMMETSSEDDPGEFIDADVTFHRELVRATQSRRLTAMHELVIGETHLCMGQVRSKDVLSSQEVAKEHRELLTAIEAGDGDGAAALLAAHIRGARDALVERLAAESGV